MQRKPERDSGRGRRAPKEQLLRGLARGGRVLRAHFRAFLFANWILQRAEGTPAPHRPQRSCSFGAPPLPCPFAKIARVTRAIGCQGKPTWSPKQLSPAIAAIPRTSPLASFSVCTAEQITRFKLDDRAGARQHCWRGRQAEAESSRPQPKCGPFHMTNIKPTCGFVQIVITNWVTEGGLPQKSKCASARALDSSYITRASPKGRAQPLRKRKVEGINRAFGTSLLLAESMKPSRKPEQELTYPKG